jgi:hypothetical protein
VTRFALFSACASLALLGACKDATTGGSGPSLGTPAAISAPDAAPKNSTLVAPVVQEAYSTFSASQKLVLKGRVGNDVSAATTAIVTTQVPVIDPISGLPAIDPVTGTILTSPVSNVVAVPVPQLATAFSRGIPSNGNTIKPSAVVSNASYEGNQPKGPVNDVLIDFNPRDAVYMVKINSSTIVADTRMQDPKHRTTFQQSLVPDIANYRYKEAGFGSDTTGLNASTTDREVSTIFVRDVGTGTNQTQYVNIAGFVKQVYSEKEVTRSNTPSSVTIGVDFESDIIRSVFAYGLNTAYKDIPKSGSANYAGDMFAHLVETPQGNPTGNDLRTIVGTSSTSVDFGSGKLTLNLTGKVEGFLGDNRAFAATGSMNIFKPEKDTTNSQFTGAITSWSFGSYNATNGIAVPTAASTIEGGFFGPSAAEIGGAFRIIGERPNERIDFLGAFVGRKN